MQSLRHQRVSELLKREIGEVIRREMPMDEAGLLTVNEVGVSGDLRSATVYVGIVGSADQQKKAIARLTRERARIQALVGRAVVLRHTPRLRFLLDASVERGNRVLSILDDLERNSPAS